MHKIIALFSIVTSLIACALFQFARTAIPLTQVAQDTQAPQITEIPVTATATENLAEPVIYYYFVEDPESAIPEGSVVILPDILILAPEVSDMEPGTDTAATIRSALEAVIKDKRNQWTNKSLIIDSVAFNHGHADVVLQGEIFGAGDVVMIAFREQILLTVFAEASVQTATITLNGGNIANLGISHIRQAKPADYTYTRTEIETFIKENASAGPLEGQERQENLPTLSLQGIWQQNRFMAAGWADRYHFYPSGTFHYYPSEMACVEEKIEKIGTWKVENTLLTLKTTKQIINRLEIYPTGLCSVIEKKEVNLTEPIIEQFPIVDLGLVEDDPYPSISINDVQFWKFSDDASSYGNEEFPE
jgi:hypothetical protein